jgi:hypothetical protein
MRWKDGGDAHQVLRSNARIAQRELKRCQTLLVLANAFGEEKLFRDHAFSQFLCTLRECEDGDFRKTFPHESIAFGLVSAGQERNLPSIHQDEHFA